MPRPKTPATLFIESFFDKHGFNVNYEDLHQSSEYANFIIQQKMSIDQSSFNAVKSRAKKMALIIEEDEEDEDTEVINKVVDTFEDFASKPIYDYEDEILEFIPELDKNFIVDDVNKSLITLVEKRSQSENVNVRLVGPAGCGKTSFATHYAAKNKLPALIMDCANVREPRDWFGYRSFDPLNKEIVWNESLFIKMIETPGSVIVLDELNRVSPLVVNTLIPLLDHRRATYLEEAKRTISCAEGVTFWAAINEGNQFTGTLSLDEAVGDRFGLVVECSFLSPENEVKVLNLRTGLEVKTCVKLVDIATQVRSKVQQHGVDTFSKPISTRMLVEAAKAMLLGGTSTLNYTLLNHYSPFGGASSERQSLAKLIIGKFGSI